MMALVDGGDENAIRESLPQLEEDADDLHDDLSSLDWRCGLAGVPMLERI